MTNLKCMYCAESGITNTDVFIEIVDVELGAGWICKECFLESEKEKDEHLKELKEALKVKEQECERLKYELILKDVANIELSDERKKYEKAINEICEIAENNYEIPEMEQIFLIIGGLDV